MHGYCSIKDGRNFDLFSIFQKGTEINRIQICVGSGTTGPSNGIVNALVGLEFIESWFFHFADNMHLEWQLACNSLFFLCRHDELRFDTARG